MRHILALSLSLAALALVPVVANAASDTATGAVGGAVTGAIVGGPVGAVVGGVIGAVIGSAVTPPPQQVVAYVNTTPAAPGVTLQGNLVVGSTLPADVQVYPIPNNVYAATPTQTYAYGYINGHKVVIDMQTHAVVAILS